MILQTLNQLLASFCYLALLKQNQSVETDPHVASLCREEFNDWDENEKSERILRSIAHLITEVSLSAIHYATLDL